MGQQHRRPTADDFEFPPDAKPDEIAAFLKKQPPIKSPPQPAAGRGSPGFRQPTSKQLIDTLPMVGGAIGGAISAPGVVTSVGGAAFGAAAGEAAKQHLNRAFGNDAPTSPMEAAGDMLTQGAVSGAAQGVGIGLGAGMTKAAPWLMQKALKPSRTLLEEYRTTGGKLAQTLLDEGVNVTSAGLSKLQSLLGKTNAEIRALVAEAPGQIEKKSVAARVLPVASKRAQQTNPTKDLKAIGETVEEFLDHPVYKGPSLSVPESQAMKQGTYQAIGKKYGEVSSAEIEAQKALARGLKEEVAEAVPQVSKLNQRDSELMAATDAVGRQVALSGNKDPVGFAWVTQNPTTFLAALIDRNPVIKSMLARGMWANAARAGKVTPDAIRAAVVALTTLGSDAQPPQE